MLPASGHVRECYTGHQGVLEAARKESLFIDCSTVDRDTVLDVVEKTSQLGANFMDAPVSGGEWDQYWSSITRWDWYWSIIRRWDRYWFSIRK